MMKKILIFLLIVGVIGAYFGYSKYQDIFSANVAEQLEDPYLFIPSNASYDEVLHQLTSKNMLIDTASFNWVAGRMNYKKPVMRSGRFKIEPGWTNRQLVTHLRGGKQAPVKVILNNERTLGQIAEVATRFIEPDSQDLAQLFHNNEYIGKFGYNQQTLTSLFIPNTYEFFWNKNSEQFFERMIKENKKFWKKNDREAKAKKLGMTKNEVYTLASIVERETNKNDEKRRIAGVYINRLKKGMLLQADPTIVFANQDFTIRRVLNKHLRFDSPYNTYMYKGLPPGPIGMASIASIDAVLKAENHNFIFFCAKPDLSGYHAFAKTLKGHNANANKYRKWITSRGIRK